MGVAGGPDIIESGLVLDLDASDKNSYPGSGTTWRDLSGNGNGSILNAVNYVSNPPSLFFDGTDEYVSLTANTTFSFTNQNITLTGWCSQLSAPGPHQTVLCTDVGYRNGIKLMSNYHGGIAVWVANSDGSADYLLSWNGIQNTGWRFLAATRNTSGELKLYLDGVLVNSVTTFTGNINTGGTSAIGRDYHSGTYYYYNGYIASSVAYNRVLSATELLQNYNAMKTRFGL